MFCVLLSVEKKDLELSSLDVAMIIYVAFIISPSLPLNQVQDFIEKKLLIQEQWVEQEAERMHNRVDREVQQFRGIALPCLVRRVLPG